MRSIGWTIVLALALGASACKKDEGGQATGGDKAAGGGDKDKKEPPAPAPAGGDLPTKEQFRAMDCKKVCEGQTACAAKFGTPATEDALKTCVDGCDYMQKVKMDSYDPAKDGEVMKRFLAFADGKCE